MRKINRKPVAPLTKGKDAEDELMLSINIMTMDKESVCLYELIIRWMYEYLDNVWILERVCGVSEWLGYYVKVRIIEWENEEVCELMSEDHN